MKNLGLVIDAILHLQIIIKIRFLSKYNMEKWSVNGKPDSSI
jgi:hypothetical protein